MILSQIVMVSPGTHLVKNRESLGPLCNQTVNLETDAKTLHYSLWKLMPTWEK